MLTSNGTSCPEQQPIVGLQVTRGNDGCNRIDVFYCQTSVSGLAEGFRLNREPRECFNAGEASDFGGLTRTIQHNGTACPADQPIMGGIKLQNADGCWRAPAVYCQSPSELLAQGGFEEFQPPLLGPPGWASDSYRQIAAKSEANQPHTGTMNGACWSTTNRDCGMYQDVAAPVTGQYRFTIYANADKSGGLIGANVNGVTVVASNVVTRGFGNYGTAYTMTFPASRADMIRVWMYSAASPGYVVIDDATLTTTF